MARPLRDNQEVHNENAFWAERDALGRSRGKMRHIVVPGFVLLATGLAFGPAAWGQKPGLEVPLITPGPGGNPARAAKTKLMWRKTEEKQTSIHVHSIGTTFREFGATTACLRIRRPVRHLLRTERSYMKK